MGKIKDYVRESTFKIFIENNQIDIQNYTDIKNITEKEITIYNTNKKIVIYGNKLTIKKLMNKEILIEGNLENIVFKDNE